MCVSVWYARSFSSTTPTRTVTVVGTVLFVGENKRDEHRRSTRAYLQLQHSRERNRLATLLPFSSFWRFARVLNPPRPTLPALFIVGLPTLQHVCCTPRIPSARRDLPLDCSSSYYLFPLFSCFLCLFSTLFVCLPKRVPLFTPLFTLPEKRRGRGADPPFR